MFALLQALPELSITMPQSFNQSKASSQYVSLFTRFSLTNSDEPSPISFSHIKACSVALYTKNFTFLQSPNQISTHLLKQVPSLFLPLRAARYRLFAQVVE